MEEASLGQFIIVEGEGKPPSHDKETASQDTSLFYELLKAVHSPSTACQNVTTSLPVNVYQLMKKNNIMVRPMVMKGILLEGLLRKKDDEIAEQKIFKNLWKENYMELKEKVNNEDK